jgi:hypothetical protein
MILHTYTLYDMMINTIHIDNVLTTMNLYNNEILKKKNDFK